ncbi:MAG: hypothetical protein RL726_851 [Actinomycetota bacterium]
MISVGCGDSSDESAESNLAVVTSTSIPTTDDTMQPAVTTTTPTDEENLVLADFTAEDSVADWYVQNDTVMGGVSSSELSWNDGDLLFSGNLSTDNNGGFTSMRGPVVPFIPASGLTAISVVAQGDGRTYLMQIRTDTDSYIQRFTPGETMSGTTLKLSDFAATDWRLSPIPDRPPLVSEAVRQVAVYLVDKQVGEFVLRLRSISMVAD